jgi:hypothetical protein
MVPLSSGHYRTDKPHHQSHICNSGRNDIPVLPEYKFEDEYPYDV